MAAVDGEGQAEVVIGTSIDPAGAPIVSLSGELDSSNADSLSAIVAPIAAEHPEHLIFDLAGLRFMDSAGIAVLISTASEVNAVSLREPSPIVRRVVELTGLSNLLLIES